MKIPKTILKDNREYTFIRVIHSNMFLYKCSLGFNTTFSRHDLGLVDNSVVDDKLNINKKQISTAIPVIVYDRLTEKETRYQSSGKAAQALGVATSTVVRKIKEHEWLDKRWFIEKEEI